MKHLKQTTVVSIAVVLAAVLGIGCLLHMGHGMPTKGTEQENMNFADEKIESLTQSSEYQNGTAEERQALADKLLNELAQGGYISDLAYDEIGGMYSFQYADGSLGGLMLKEFTTPPGGLPMN